MAKAINEPIFPECPIRNVLARICDKWSMLVIFMLEKHQAEPLRFNALRKMIPDISQKMLTTTLRNLEADGFLVREVFPEVPPHTEYQLTQRAISFMDACQPMIAWSLENFADIIRDRESRTSK